MLNSRSFLLIIIIEIICFTAGNVSVYAESVSENADDHEMYQCTVSLKTFDEQKIITRFFGDKKIQRTDNESNETSVIQCENALLTISKGSLDFQNDEQAGIEGDILFDPDLPVEGNANPDENAEVQDLASWLREVCVSSDEEQLDMIHVESYESPKLREQLDQIGKVDTFLSDMMDENTFKDYQEFTKVEYELSFGGVPLLGGDEPGPSFYLDIAPPMYVIMQGLFGDGNLLYLNIEGIFDVISSEEVSLISQSEAEKNAKEALLTASPENENVVFQEKKLEYVLLPDWETESMWPTRMVPYWYFMYEKVDEDGYSSQYPVRINAITGGNMTYGE